MTFWIFAGGLSALTLAVMLWPLMRPKAQSAMRSSYDVQIYKDQLKEVEADLARGTLSEAEANASRTEVSRRLLAAADAEAGETTSGNATLNLSRALAIVVCIAVLAGGFGIYQQLGVQACQTSLLPNALAPAQRKKQPRKLLRKMEPDCQTFNKLTQNT